MECHFLSTDAKTEKSAKLAHRISRVIDGKNLHHVALDKQQSFPADTG
jgi:hypothetical protein